MKNEKLKKGRAVPQALELTDEQLKNVVGGLENAAASTLDILKALKVKVINAANDTNTDTDRRALQKELGESMI